MNSRLTNIIHIGLLLIIVTLAFDSKSQNQSPVAVNDTVFISNPQISDTIYIDFLSNDYDPDGDELTVLSTSSDGIYKLEIDEISYLYFNGSLSINYTIRDPFWAHTNGKIVIFIDNDSQGFIENDSLKVRVNANNCQFFNISSLHSSLSNGSNSPIQYEWPKGDSTSPIFTHSIWLAGIDSEDSLHLSANKYLQTFDSDIYGGSDFQPGPLPLDLSSPHPDQLIYYDRIWKLSIDDINYHLIHYKDADYKMQEEIETWPAHGNPLFNEAEYLAPFIDTDQDGIYTPLNGDYPKIRGDECIYFIMNDNKVHSESKGEKINVETHVMAYLFKKTIDRNLINTTFYNYKVINRSNEDYREFYWGIFTDFDLGASHDDYIMCDIQRNATIAYNSLPNDEFKPEVNSQYLKPYRNKIPASAMFVLSGPLADYDYIDNPDNECDNSVNGLHYGDGIIDNERLGLNSHLIYNYSLGDIFSDAIDLAEEYYYNLQGIWKDLTFIQYGGAGHYSTEAYGPACRFQYPGTSDPCNWGTFGTTPYGPIDWTMENNNIVGADLKSISSLGPFTLKAGDVQEIDIAFTAAFPEGDNTALEALKHRIDKVNERFAENSFDFSRTQLSSIQSNSVSPEINLFPNPTDTHLHIELSYEESTSFHYHLYDMQSNVLKSGILYTNQKNRIDLSGLNSAIYVLSISNEEFIINKKIIVAH